LTAIGSKEEARMPNRNPKCSHPDCQNKAIGKDKQYCNDHRFSHGKIWVLNMATWKWKLEERKG
jgi:hypothetical protein